MLGRGERWFSLGFEEGEESKECVKKFDFCVSGSAGDKKLKT